MVAIQRWRGLAMKRPLFIPSLSAEETRALEAGLRSRDAFTLRRAQMLLASARGDRPLQIATSLGCNNQTVLNALHAFQTEGLACLRAKSSAPHRVLHAVWSTERDAELRELRLCRKFCSGGREGAVAPHCEGIKQPGSRTIRPQ